MGMVAVQLRPEDNQAVSLSCVVALFRALQVELFVVKAISAKLLEGKIDQIRSEVSVCVLRAASAQERRL